MEVPDGYSEFPEDAENAADTNKPVRNELVFIVGRFFRDDKQKKKYKNQENCWVYE